MEYADYFAIPQVPKSKGYCDALNNLMDSLREDRAKNAKKSVVEITEDTEDNTEDTEVVEVKDEVEQSEHTKDVCDSDYETLLMLCGQADMDTIVEYLQKLNRLNRYTVRNYIARDDCAVLRIAITERRFELVRYFMLLLSPTTSFPDDKQIDSWKYMLVNEEEKFKNEIEEWLDRDPNYTEPIHDNQIRSLQLELHNKEVEKNRKEYEEWKEEHEKYLQNLQKTNPEQYDREVRGSKDDFIDACMRGTPEQVQAFLSDEKYSKDDEEKELGLWWACRSGNEKTVKFLLNNGVRYSYSNPLFWPCELGHVSIVEMLLNVGIIPNEQARKAGANHEGVHQLLEKCPETETYKQHEERWEAYYKKFHEKWLSGSENNRTVEKDE